jgi:hydroxyacylglutathione hydrolase
MIVQRFMSPIPPFETNQYIVGCTETKLALMVDAGRWDARMEDYLADHGLTLTTIFITHGHFDHVEGLADALKATGAEAFSATGEVGGVTTRVITPRETLTVGTLSGRVVATPGHTPDGLSLIFPGVVFSGDALFSGSVGGTATPDLAAEQLAHVRAHLLSLPDDVEVLSGHGPVTTIGVERRFNPFLK